MAFIIFFLLLKKFEKVEKTGFFRANTQISNLNVLHKGLLLQDWVFRLGFYLNSDPPEMYSVTIANELGSSRQAPRNFII